MKASATQPPSAYGFTEVVAMTSGTFTQARPALCVHVRNRCYAVDDVEWYDDAVVHTAGVILYARPRRRDEYPPAACVGAR